jgi:hypothetical protein
MEAWEIFVLIIVIVSSIIGLGLIIYGLKHCGLGCTTKAKTYQVNTDEHINSMKKKTEAYKKLLQELESKREQLKKSADESDPSADSDDKYWQIYDLEWRMDDLNWSIDDINWDIRDARFEYDWRKEQEKTTKATFWTVLGAASFSLAGLLFSIL